MTRGATSAALVLLALFGAGCASAPVDRYYTLDSPDTGGGNGGTIPATVKVRTFDTSEIYRQERIVRRSGENEITYYDTHRWAGPLERLITEQAVEVFRSQLPVQRVLPWASAGDSDFLIDGHVLLFEEVLEGDRPLASVRLRLQLVDRRDRPYPTLWEGEVEKSCEIYGARPEATPGALSYCLHGVLQELSGVLGEKLSEVESQEEADRR